MDALWANITGVHCVDQPPWVGMESKLANISEAVSSVWLNTQLSVKY